MVRWVGLAEEDEARHWSTDAGVPSTEGLTLTPGMRWNRKSLTTQSPVGSSLRDGALGLEREDSESRNPQTPLFTGARRSREPS